MPAQTQELDYHAYFKRMIDLRRLQAGPDEVAWNDRATPDPTAVDVVLYLGCNIQRTPFIAAQVIEVFEHLGVDFAAVGGVRFCCGVPWDPPVRVGSTQGANSEKGLKVLKRTMGSFAAYRPREVVMWCPSCNVRFDRKLDDGSVAPPDFALSHTTQFLARLADEQALPWVRELDLDVVLHTHEGPDEDANGKRRAREDREAAGRLLRAVPGVRVVGELRTPPEMDFDCGPAIVELERERFDELRDGFVAQARRLEADAVVTISHACHREWAGGPFDASLRLVNYIQLVADALGLTPRQDTLLDLHQASSLDDLVERSRPAWTSHGMREDQARELLTFYFVDKTMAP